MKNKTLEQTKQEIANEIGVPNYNQLDNSLFLHCVSYMFQL